VLGHLADDSGLLDGALEPTRVQHPPQGGEADRRVELGLEHRPGEVRRGLLPQVGPLTFHLPILHPRAPDAKAVVASRDVWFPNFRVFMHRSYRPFPDFG
jgi:hypothetical protein